MVNYSPSFKDLALQQTRAMGHRKTHSNQYNKYLSIYYIGSSLVRDQRNERIITKNVGKRGVLWEI